MATPDKARASTGVEGARDFHTTGAAYDAYMGRYSRPLAARFADAAGIRPGWRALDLGCGPGALTGVLVERLGAASVAAVDPSAAFVAECRTRFPTVDVRPGSAESIPHEDRAFDAAMAGLVLHFVTDAEQAGRELRRVLRPGGVVAASVWDFAEGMEMLRAFWDAALAVDPDAPDEARTLKFGGPGEIAGLWEAAGFVEIDESELTVESTYSGFEELWHGFQGGIGPAGSYCAGLAPATRHDLREALFRRLGSPPAAFTLSAVARCAVARAPG